MLDRITDTHQQFASFFEDASLKLFAQKLSYNLEKGSICLNLKDHEELKEESQKLPSLHHFVGLDKPFVLDGDRLYLRRYFNYESQIIDRLKKFQDKSEEKFAERLGKLQKSPYFSHLKSKADPKLTIDWQLVASIMGFLQDFCIITGGPGTGKTTTLAKILTLLWGENPELKVKLAAPTGKAAMRMEESLRENTNIPVTLKPQFENIQASTLHRLLGYNHGSPYFKHNRENPLSSDVVIVDESSMIDVALFAKLLNAVGDGTRLILLGDQNQLASVEAGSIFGDLCNVINRQNHFSHQVAAALSGLLNNIPATTEPAPLQDHLVLLSHSYRFKEEEGIGKLSEAIIKSDSAALSGIMETADNQVFFDIEHNEQTLKDFTAGFIAYIEEDAVEKALKALNELRVLAAVRMGKQGIYELNKRIEGYLYASGHLKGGGEFYHNRPILITQNQHDLNLFNGDIGIVRNIDGQTKVYFLDGKDGIKAFSPAYLPDVETVFAMTIHKSQGSEFNRVLVVLPKKEEMELLTRELLYTAVTRAKEKVIIQGSKEIILEAIGKQVKRASGIQQRLA